MGNFHFDFDIVSQDLIDMVEGFNAGSQIHSKHKELSLKLSDPDCHNRKQAVFGAIVKCVSCANKITHSLHTIWQRGMPVHISLADGDCPHCDGKKGFHFAEVKTLHA